MSIFKKFTASAASAALTVTSAAASLTAVVIPQEAAAQRIREPDSCRRLDREQYNRARENYNIERRASRDVGNSIRRGGSIGDIGRSILGSQAERQLNDLTRDNSYLRDLQYQCERDRQIMQDGVCTTRSSERGYIATENGYTVGRARGGIDERRDCERTNYGSPSDRTLTGNGRTGRMAAQERQYDDAYYTGARQQQRAQSGGQSYVDRLSPAERQRYLHGDARQSAHGGAGHTAHGGAGHTAHGGAGHTAHGGTPQPLPNSGRDFSKCAVGQDVLICPTANGGVERVPLPSGPAPRR